jgi:hypothetical protein
MDKLDPTRTALLLVHMAKGVAGPVDTPFNRLFGRRAEKAGIIGVQARLLDGAALSPSRRSMSRCPYVR